MSIVQSYRYNDMTYTKVKCARKAFLNPELFQFNLTSLFGFYFPFSSFFILSLVCRACASVLKLNLWPHTPAFTKVISHVDYYVRKIKSAMRAFVFIFGRLIITENIIAIKVPWESHFAISSYTKTVTTGMTHYWIARINLSASSRSACHKTQS